MEKTKKITALTITAAMLMGSMFAGCGTEKEEEKTSTASNQSVSSQSDGAASGEPANISVIIETFDNTFASFVMSAMEEYESEHSDELKLTILDSKQDANNQISQVENQILNGTDAIICLAVDAKQTTPIVKACEEADIPLIAFNRVFEGCDTFVGADGEVAGRLLAEFAGEQLDGKGNVAIVNGIMGQENQFIRRDAIVNTLEEKYPDMKVVIEGAGDWKRDKGLQLAETWLQSGTDIDAILCLNDDMAMGAYQAVEQAGKTDEVMVCGVNGDPDGIKGVKNGELAATVFQNPDLQAVTALETALQYIRGEQPAAEIMIDFELVTAENVDEYMQYAE